MQHRVHGHHALQLIRPCRVHVHKLRVQPLIRDLKLQQSVKHNQRPMNVLDRSDKDRS